MNGTQTIKFTEKHLMAISSLLVAPFVLFFASLYLQMPNISMFLAAFLKLMLVLGALVFGTVVLTVTLQVLLAKASEKLKILKKFTRSRVYGWATFLVAVAFVLYSLHLTNILTF